MQYIVPACYIVRRTPQDIEESGCQIQKTASLPLGAHLALRQSGFDSAANIAPADLKIIKGVAAEYVRDIFRRLREHGYDETTMTLYVTGGGGCLVKNFYKFSADRVKFVEDICAAAKGYEYLAEAQMKAEAKG